MAAPGVDVRKAVIPAAGLGSGFLPFTKAVPKELLPLVDRPVIDYAVAEAVAAGLDDVLLITGRGKAAIEDYFDTASGLEAALRERGDDDALTALREVGGAATIHTVRQGPKLGLGHAVLRAAEHVGNEPFAVLLSDDLIDRRDPVLPALLEVRRQRGGSVIALLEVPPERISAYGAVSCRATDRNDVVAVTDLVEKPRMDQAPSNLAVLGRYVLDPVVFDVLRETRPGRDGEIQLTDALRTMTDLPRDNGGGVHGVVFRGRHYDTGDKQSYLRAVVSIALADPDLGPAFGQWLNDRMADRRGAAP